jgi:cell division protein FtsL
MKIPCSSCNQRLEIPEELAGQTIDCPACKASLAVPAIEAPPPPTSRIEATAPQAVAPQKFSPKRKIEAQPKAASNMKPKSSIPKWAIASVAGVAVVVVVSIMFFPGIIVEVPKEVPDYNTHIEDKRRKFSELTPQAKSDFRLRLYAETGKIEAFKKQLAAGANVNAKDEYGDTPLHLAALMGHKEIVEKLINASADVNAKDAHDRTPLDNAQTNARFGHQSNKETADLLRKHGGKTGEELEAEGK